MILYVMTVCLAVYASPSSESPLTYQCVRYRAPIAYDVTLCPGEVTTNRTGTLATCEVNLREESSR